MSHNVLVSRDSGDRLIVLVGTEESAGERFRFEYVARSGGPRPPSHVHADQEESIEVLEGTLACRIAGEDHLLGPGDTMVIPPGEPHAVWSPEPSGCRSIGEFRPARDTQTMFERYFAARPSH
jgi:quercetin dioxygenase-like cupin family protein